LVALFGVSGLFGLVLSFDCGALAAAAAHNPQPKDKPKPLSSSLPRQGNTNSMLAFHAQPH